MELAREGKGAILIGSFDAVILCLQILTINKKEYIWPAMLYLRVLEYQPP